MLEKTISGGTLYGSYIIIRFMHKEGRRGTLFYFTRQRPNLILPTYGPTRLNSLPLMVDLIALFCRIHDTT